MSNSEIILEFLETVPRGCCDSCVSRETGVEPHQQVNQICRGLEQQGKSGRQEGPCALCNKKRILNIVSFVPPGKPTTPVPVAQRSGQRQRSVDIEDLRNHLDRFCKVLVNKHKVADKAVGLARIISSLSDFDAIPYHEASMMHTIRSLRNAYVHDHVPMGAREAVIAEASWDIIREWAENHEPEAWRLATT